MIVLRINGSIYKLEIDPEMPLLWVLRDQVGLTGTKYSCGIGECGACTVHVDGEAVPSCTLTVKEVTDSHITTNEGLKGPIADVLRKAWIEEDVPQCGYCQSGQIMAAAALLRAKPHPTDADIDGAMSGVLCRCGTYLAIRRAIHRAAQEMPPW